MLPTWTLPQDKNIGVQLMCLTLLLALTGCSGMDVIMASPKNVTALNGTEVKISCIFQSCYKMDPSVFVMNWTFQETKNDTEKMLMKFDKKKGMVPLRLDHFGDRVKFVGNLEKNDMSITLSEVEVKDEGYYHCNIINHPDRNAGRNNITLLVVLELSTPEDTTNAVAIGASVGGALALLILSMVVVKCLRHHKKQELISEEKMEEEEKLEAEVVTEEGTKQGYSLPEDA
ncbi:sodium channel subunit beta-2 isoform X1 [Gadus macrocephalus]|uniref:sodium channel subunit beta-2 isoform X1 n=2 Tax=Gadus macrocephalus TaxID=80720 RepID=UPI0028CB961B|nr:sodium channel subunit beta-2 isoform X1 [Gadus macrocephalus]